MEKVITNVEVKEGKFGMYKTLYFDNGKKMSITASNHSFGVFTGAGTYDLTFKNYNGKEVIAGAKRLSKGDLQAAQDIIGKKPITAAQSMEDRINFEREKQKDIMIEYYMGIAKDVVIANKKESDIKSEDIEKMAFELVASHYRVKNGENIPAIVGDIQAAFPEAELEQPEFITDFENTSKGDLK